MCLLFQQPQAGAARTPWAVLIVVGVLVLAGVSFIVYLFMRLKTSDKEIEEEDWKSSRHTLLVEPEPPHSHVPTDVDRGRDASVESELLARTREIALVPEPRPSADALGSAIEEQGGTAEYDAGNEAATGMSQGEDATPILVEPVAEVPHSEAAKSESPVSAPAASPFGEDVWAALETPPVDVSPTPSLASVPQKVETPRVREPFEPPRIEPILPRDVPAGAGLVSGTPVPPVTSLDASQRTPAPQARLQTAAGNLEIHTGIDTEPALPKTDRGGKHVTGAILGLPSEPSAGPMILGEPAHRLGEPEVASLSHYGEALDDSKGRGGLITLLAVVLIVAAAALSYLLVPSVHANVNAFMAKLKAGEPVGPPPPKAQIFRLTYEANTNPIKVTCALQNSSSEVLSGLKVDLTLEPKDVGQPSSIQAQVTPDQVTPGQQGTFEFTLDGNLYKGYRIKDVKAGNGSTVPFATPSQQ